MWRLPSVTQGWFTLQASRLAFLHNSVRSNWVHTGSVTDIGSHALEALCSAIFMHDTSH